MAAPANGVDEYEGSDTGGYQHDYWAAHREKEKKNVKHAVQSADHGSVPEVVIVNVRVPEYPLRVDLVETRDLIHSSDGEAHESENPNNDGNEEGDVFGRHANLSFQGEQDTDTALH